jgi:hypothetical protein
MLSKLFLATVATIGLLLAGPQKASAQVVHACVSSAANSPIIIEPTADAPCPPSAGGTTWTKVTLSQTPGAIGASAFSCNIKGGNDLTNGGSLTGSAGNFIPGISFGSGISYNNGTTFLLQPGTYLVQLSVPDVFLQYQAQPGGQTATFRVRLTVNGIDSALFDVPGSINTIPNSVSAFVAVNGNQLFNFLGANTVIGFNVIFNTDRATTSGGCQIVFTQLQ